MYEAVRYGTAVYRNELARRVQEIGYRIAPAKHGLEIEDVSEVILKRFSKRSQQLDSAVRENGAEARPQALQRRSCLCRASESRSEDQGNLDGGSPGRATGASA